MENYTNGELSIGVEESATTIRLQWEGKSSARDPGSTLVPFFERVIGAAGRTDATVEVDFSRLEYFNSSTLAAIIRSLQLSKRAEVKVVVRYDGSVGWQRRSCDALRVLEDGKGLLALEDNREAV